MDRRYYKFPKAKKSKKISRVYTSNNKTPLKMWVDYLKDFYQIETIKKYYRQNNGSQDRLNDLFIKKFRKQNQVVHIKGKQDLIKSKREQRSYFNNKKTFKVSIVKQLRILKQRGYQYKIFKTSDKIKITIDKPIELTNFIIDVDAMGYEYKFNKWFKHISHYFINITTDKDLVFLEKSLKQYYFEFIKRNNMKKILNKKNEYEEEKAIKDIFDKAQRLLDYDREIHFETARKLEDRLPEIKIKTLKELKEEVESKIFKLNIKLHTAYTIPSLLKELREL